MRRTIFESEHEQFRESARRFFQKEIGPNGERWREQGYVDREAYLKAGEQGFLLMWADPEYGGAGYMDEYAISRLYTGARISRIFAGSNEIMREIIGRSLELDDRKLNKG